MSEAFDASQSNTAEMSARYGQAVTPSNSTNMPHVTRAIYVGGAGNIAAVMASGDTVLFVAVPAGALLPICVKRINSTNTTAVNMVALW